MVLSALISAAGPIIGSLLAPKPKERTPRDTIMSTVQGAREAGIHPLAALGAQPQFQQVGGGGVSTGTAIGEGISEIGRQMGAAPAEKGNAALVAASTEAQLAQAELFRTQSRTMIANAANAAIGGPSLKGSGPPLWSERDAQSDAPMQLFGQNFIPRPGDPPAQRAQDWYGEAGEFIQGLSNFVRSNPGSLPTDDLDKKLMQMFRSWYVRNRGNPALGPMP